MLLAVVIGLIVVALAFDFINGFHDAANSIATVVSTRVLSPITAVAWAAFFNFVAAAPVFFGGELRVAQTIGKGVIQFDLLKAQGVRWCCRSSSPSSSTHSPLECGERSTGR